jgi:hypothetical protein
MKRFKIYHDDDIIGGQIPDSWEELTVKQWAALRPDVTDLELLSILSNIDLSYLENTRADLSPAIEHVYHSIKDMPADLNKLPKKAISLLGHQIKFPKDLNFERYGQKAMVKNLIKDKEDMREVVAEVFAIYAQPSIDGKFDSAKIKPIIKAVEALPIISVFPWALFFLKKCAALKRSYLVDWNQYQRQPSK